MRLKSSVVCRKMPCCTILVLHHDGRDQDVQDADMSGASLEDAFEAPAQAAFGMLGTHTLQHAAAVRLMPGRGQGQSSRALCGVC